MSQSAESEDSKLQKHESKKDIRRYFQHAITTSYQQWVWERGANINWSMVTCQGSTRLELP